MVQNQHTVVDVTQWEEDVSEVFSPYPEGAREKRLLYAPQDISTYYKFLTDGHCYLFKLSHSRYPEEFWSEIIAYRLSVPMGILIPPAFAAYNASRRESGALIEWFLDPPNESDSLTLRLGGDLFLEHVNDFDRKKGKQHNFQTLSLIFKNLAKSRAGFSNWKQEWAKIFLFDALIGNTDRHQNNWGILKFEPKELSESTKEVAKLVSAKWKLSPTFDNGTSMGREYSVEELLKWDNEEIKRYVLRGTHHIKWHIGDPKKAKHNELLKMLASEYPETRDIMLNCLSKVNSNVFEGILSDLSQLNDISVKLTRERADFMLKLLNFRHQWLFSELEK